MVVLELGYYLTRVAIDHLSLSRQLRQLGFLSREVVKDLYVWAGEGRREITRCF
jgi:hypothetical protein